MSNVIDKRVASLELDNSKFEKNATNTIKTIGELDKSLQLKNGTKGLNDVAKAAGNVSLSALSSAVTTVEHRFSALQVVAVTALANITNSAINTGKQMLSSLTTDPLTTGFKEYETKMGSIQTILSNTSKEGTDLEKVTSVIDDMNTYADKTIYNFAEMTRNLGTFTAAGVTLDKSAEAIKGIANLAAASGSTSEQASRAMYQLSQALASGKVSLQDWNSVVNAGMGGVLFQDALKETAKTMGIVVDESVSFRDSISSKGGPSWLTSDVLVQTLRQFTGDLSDQDLADFGYSAEQIEQIQKTAEIANNAATQVKTFTQLMSTLQESAQSGWGRSWELLIGNFEEAKVLFTAVNDEIGSYIGATADARNAMLETWKNEGGRDKAIQAVVNIYKTLSNTLKAVNSGFRSIFPKTTGDDLLKYTDIFFKLSETLTISDENLSRIHSTVAGVSSAFSIVFNVIKSVVRVFSELISNNTSDFSFLNFILGITSNIGNVITNLDIFLKQSDAVYLFLKKIIAPAEFVLYLITDIIRGITSFINGVELNIFEDFIVNLESLFSKLDKTLNSFFGFEIDIFDKILGTIYGYTDKINSSIENVGTSANVMSAGVISSISEIDMSMNKSTFFNTITSIFDSILSAGQKVIEIIAAIGKHVIGIIKDISLDDITNFALLLASGALYKSMSAFSDSMESIFDVLEAFSLKIKSEALMNIAKALLILAGSMFVMSLLDTENLIVAIGAVSSLFYGLITAMKSLATLNFTGMGVLAALPFILLGVSISVGILSVAVASLGQLDFSTIIKGVGGITAVMYSLSTAMKSFGGFSAGLAFTTAFSIVGLAFAISILSGSVKKLGQMNFNALIQGLLGVGVVLYGFSTFMNSTAGLKFNPASLLAIGAMSLALRAMSGAVYSFGSMKLTDMVQGLGGIAAALWIIVNSMNKMPPNLLATATGIGILGIALNALSLAVLSMGSMSLTTIGKGLIGLGGGLLILAPGLKAMTGTLAGSASLVVAVAAMALLPPIIKLMSLLDWGTVAKGLAVIAVSIATIAGVSRLLIPVAPVLLTVATAIGIVSLATIGFGVGLALMSLSILSLTVALSAFVAMFVFAGPKVAEAIETIFIGFAKAIPALLSAFAEGVIEFIEVLGDGAERISIAVKKIIVSMMDTLSSSAYEIGSVLGEMLLNAMRFVTANIKEFSDMILEWIVVVLNSVADRMPEIIDSVKRIWNALVMELKPAFDQMDSESILKGAAAFGALSVVYKAIQGAAAGLPLAMKGLAAIGILVGELALIIAALGALNSIPGFEWLVNKGGDLLGAIGSSIGKMIGGFAGGVVEQFSKSLPEIGKNLNEFMYNMEYFLYEVRKIDLTTVESVGQLALIIGTMTAASLLESIFSFLKGENSLIKFGKSLVEFAYYFRDYNDIIKNVNADILTKTSNVANSLAIFAQKVPNSGGLISLFSGENSMTSFGAELVEFGEYFSLYSESIKNVDPMVVSKTSNAVLALVTLAEKLPNTGGLVSLFSGDNSIDVFGEQLTYFGYSLSDYSLAIKDVDLKKQSEIMYELNRMFTFMRKISTIDFDSVDDFSNSMYNIANDAVVGFLNAFEKSTNIIEPSISTFLFQISTTITNKKQIIVEAVKSVNSGILTSITSNNETILKSIETLIKDILKKIEDEEQSFIDKGIFIINSLGIGIDRKTDDVITQITDLMEDMENEITSTNSSFIELGKELMVDFVAGIKSKYGAVMNAARNAAEIVYDSLSGALDINSPSGKSLYLGAMYGEGFIQGYENVNQELYGVTEKISETAINGLYSSIKKINSFLEDDINFNPVITPIIDISDISNKSKTINSLLSGNKAIGINEEMSYKNGTDNNSEDLKSNSNEQTTVVYNQYNNSPKALSNIEIYRQTKNQLSRVKGVN